MEDHRGREGKLNGKKSERETNHEGLWTLETKLRVTEGRGLLNTYHSVTPFSTHLPSVTLSLVLRVLGLSWFVSLSDFFPFSFPSLPLSSSALFLILHI